MRESQIEKRCRLYAIELGFLTYKFRSPQNNAVPDRIFISPSGDTLYFEFKAKGKEPSALQAAVIEEFQERGCNVFVVDDFKEGQAILDSFILI